MNLTKAFSVIGICTVIGTVVGTTIGWLLGRFVPTFYRFMFEDGQSKLFNPEEMGFGLGLVQGLILGLAVGTLVVVVITVREIFQLKSKCQ